MPQPTNPGLDMQSMNEMVLIPERVPGEFDPHAPVYACPDWKPDYQPEERFETFRASGHNADTWTAKTYEQSNAPGSFKPCYNEMDKWLLGLCGNPVKEELIAGGAVIRKTYAMPDKGRRDILTYTGEWGEEMSVKRMTMGLINAFSITSDDQNGTQGNVGMMFRDPIAEDVPQSRPETRNHVAYLEFLNAIGPIAFQVPTTSLGGGATVNVTDADTVASLTTKFAAVPSIGSAANVLITGTLAPSTGQDYAMYGTLIHASDVYSGGLNMSAERREKLHDNDNNSRETLRCDGQTPILMKFDLGQSRTFTKVRIRSGAATGLIFEVSLYADRSFSGSPSSVIYAETNRSFTVDTFNELVLTAAATGRYVQIKILRGSAADLRVDEVELIGAGVGFSGRMTLELRGELANSYVNDITTNTAVKGVSIVTVYRGSNGRVIERDPLPILYDHWAVYRANTEAELGTPDTLMESVDTFDFSLANLVNVNRRKNRSRTYYKWTDGEALQTSGSVRAETRDNHVFDMLVAKDKYVSGAQWFLWEALCTDGLHAFKIKWRASVGANVPYEVNNNVYERRFPLMRIHNPLGNGAKDESSLRFIVEMPT